MTHQATPMEDGRPTRSAIEALEAAGAATGAEDLTRKEQHDAINLYAKQTFPRERSEMSDNQARVSIECIVK